MNSYEKLGHVRGKLMNSCEKWGHVGATFHNLPYIHPELFITFHKVSSLRGKSARGENSRAEKFARGEIRARFFAHTFPRGREVPRVPALAPAPTLPGMD